MSLESGVSSDPRRPQGNWPLIVFIAGLIAAGLISCQPTRAPLDNAPKLTQAGEGSAAPAMAQPVIAAAAPASSAPKDGGKLAGILAALGAAPDAAACQTAFKTLLADSPITFKTGSAKLSAASEKTLDGAASIAEKCKAHMIEAGGHTDRSGAARANLRLSNKRASAVKAYLVKAGLPASGLSAKGYGEANPVDSGKGAAAAAKNRRIEFTVAAKS